MSTFEYIIGQRICLDHQHRGTILYVGEVLATSGTWLGIEWDDVSRGKHNGCKDGHHYFSVTIPGSATFIRPSDRISTGQSFTEAITSKYLANQEHAITKSRLPGEVERVTLFESVGSSFDIEVVDLEQVRRKMSQLEKLVHVGIEECQVGDQDNEEQLSLICNRFQRLQSINLTGNLLTKFDTICKLLDRIPTVKSLILNDNRLSTPTLVRSEILSRSLKNISLLRLRKTFLDWANTSYLLHHLPGLTELDCSANLIEHAEALEHDHTLRSLSLEDNQLVDFQCITSLLSTLPRIQQLNLQKNKLRTIVHATTVTFPTLQDLHASQNAIEAWENVDALQTLFPNVSKLTILGNPFLAEVDESVARLLTIARIPSLTSLEFSVITSAERREAEAFYWSRISTLGSLDGPNQHRRWQELCTKFGKPDAVHVEKRTDSIESRLITLNVKSHQGQFQVTVLPTTKIRILRSRLTQLLGRPCSKHKAKLVVLLKSQECGDQIEVQVNEAQHESEELAWFGVEDGDAVRVEFA